MPKILITGGAGFIGSHLAEKLLGQSQEVFVIDNLSTGRLENIKHLHNNQNFHFIKGSVLDEKLITELIGKVEQIYHLAAVVGVRKVLQEPVLNMETNVLGTSVVLRVSHKCQSKPKVLIASSSEVYGKNSKIPFAETGDRTYGSVYKMRWAYAVSKAADEFLGLAYVQQGLPVIIVRLFNVIGPRQTGAYGMVVPTFVKQALKREPITVFGDGEQTRCFTDVEDVVDALIKLMTTDKSQGKVINLGSDKEISIKQLAKKIKDLTASPSEIVYVPYQQAYPEGYEDFRRRAPDLTKIKELIGFQPKFSLEQSIKKIIASFNIP